MDKQLNHETSESLVSQFKRATGAGVTVAVIDSGWDSDLTDWRIQQGISFVDLAGEFVKSSDTEDALGHGTACADLVLQTAPDARIVPVRIFGRKLHTTTTTLAQAIRWAATQQIDIINLSLGTTEPDALRPLYAACEFAHRRGSILVAAANRNELQRNYPAIFDNVIGVDVGEENAYRPNAAIEFLLGGTRHARWLGGLMLPVEGTSFAAPVAAGIVARLRELFPTAPLAEIHELLADVLCFRRKRTEGQK